jgi:hypothetical protein|tara:strand:+ start:1335 stop:1568 length:234 start_codon:yes stop_codon:yes gene_type:complete
MNGFWTIQMDLIQHGGAWRMVGSVSATPTFRFQQAVVFARAQVLPRLKGFDPVVEFPIRIGGCRTTYSSGAFDRKIA